MVEYAVLDDQRLIELIVQAHEEALSVLYDRYGRLVFSMALNALGDYSAAEEITQDVFVRVWLRADQYHEGKAKVSTWLTSIARYRIYDQLRHNRSRPEQNAVTWADISEESVPLVNSSEQLAGTAMEQKRIRAAVAALPDEQKQVLAMAYFQNMSQSQIATNLNIPLGTVKTRIRLGMQKLRDMFM